MNNSIDELLQENNLLKNEIENLKQHLKKYTSPSRNKTYYKKHREEVIQKVKQYKETTQYKYTPSTEQKKKWARTAYLKKKEKQNSSEGEV